jgi:uncharacterized protein YkwD
MYSARVPRARSALLIASIATALATLAAVVGFTQTTAYAGGSYRWNKGDKCFMKRINKARAKHDLRRLRRDVHLGYVAKRHARRMAKKGSMYHQPDLGSKVTNWSALAQNTGVGGGCPGLHRAFMESPAHAANVLGHYKYMGVATKWRGDTMYVQVIFESKKNPGNIY